MWSPTTFRRYVRTIESSSRPAYIDTDAGPAYLKAANNPEGPHILACDWFGTRLAQKFHLPTLEVAILPLTSLDEIPIGKGIIASPEPAFVSRAEQGATMGGSGTLEYVENLYDIPRIVVFDTWVRNCDRYCPTDTPNGKPRINVDNVFLSVEGATQGKFILKPIDHGHIFSCGKQLTPKLSNISNVQERKLYGLFPEFRKYVTIESLHAIVDELADIRPTLWEDLLHDLPDAWHITDEIRAAINSFLIDRAQFLSNNLREIAYNELHPGKIDFDANQTQP